MVNPRQGAAAAWGLKSETNRMKGVLEEGKPYMKYNNKKHTV
jgi:hypothetical protein